MRYSCDFIDGPVTDRLLYAIRERDANAITTMLKEGKFRVFQNSEYLITSKNLLPNYIEDYVKDSGVTVYDVFYGIGAPVDTSFTKSDKVVLYFLDHVPAEKLASLFDYMQKVYPNSFYYVGADLKPSRKLREILLRLPRGSLSRGNKSFNMPGIGHLSEFAQIDLKHYLRIHASPSYTFDNNCMPEYAEFLGISLHWIWNLSGPLYCKTAIADQIFDYYTLMQPEEQAEFVHFILYYNEEQNRRFSSFFEEVGEL